MKLENMNQEFPKMPDAMRKMIEQEVEQQLQKKTSKFTGRRVMIAVLQQLWRWEPPHLQVFYIE